MDRRDASDSRVTTAQATDAALRGLRVLVPTNREIYRLVSYGMVQDFENAVARASDADLVAVPLPSRRARMSALRQGRPLRPVEPPRSTYDLCFFVAMDPYWMPTLGYVRRLRESARQVVVYLFDAWLGNTAAVKRYRRLWSLVDHVFISFSHAMDAYSALLDCEVHYLPQAIDERWFHPYRDDRPIDVLSVGRRLPSVHRDLLDLSRRADLFYHYQTASAPQAIDLAENQALLGNLYQRAKIQVNWPIDETNAMRTGEGSAITARWFESAASGGIVVGRRPPGRDFDRVFPFDGFVREIDLHTTGDSKRVVTAALADRSDRAERLALAEHVRTVHTWAVRWRQIVEACGALPR
jgi:hypothetical protein